MKQKTRRLLAFAVALAIFTSFVTCPNVEASAKLKVKSSKNITLNIGKTSQIKTNVEANKLKFKSSKKKVATVNSKGKITAKKAGKTNITVTSKKNKKQKVTIKVTVVKKRTMQATTESKVTTTQQTAVVTTQIPSVTTTTQVLGSTTTTSSGATTENTSAGDATTEERKVVGITAKYRGDKVPDNLEYIDEIGVKLQLVYSDNSTEEVIRNAEVSNNMDMNYLFTEVIDGLKYANYKISYLGYETTFKIQLVETTTLYPIQIDTKYTGGTIPKNTIPDKEDIEASILLSDCETSMDADMSIVRLVCYKDWNTSIYDKRKEYQYEVIYDYTFKDENDNDLYVCCYFFIYVPYE